MILNLGSVESAVLCGVSPGTKFGEPFMAIGIVVDGTGTETGGGVIGKGGAVGGGARIIPVAMSIPNSYIFFFV